jgi:hypothetical protein
MHILCPHCRNPIEIVKLNPRLPRAAEVFWASPCLVSKPAASMQSIHQQPGGRKEAKVDKTTTQRRWTAAELRKLPPQERGPIMEAAAAEQEYRTNPQLTACEAFGKDDLYGECSSTETL